MNSDDTLKITELDRQVGNSRLQMLKAALPYLSTHQQSQIAILTKWLEFQSTIHMFGNPEEVLSICETKVPPPGPFGILDAIKQYGSKEDQSRINFAQNFLQAMSLYQQMEAMQSEQPESSQASEPEEPLETQEWNNDPKLKSMDPQKLSFLMDMANKSRSQSADSLLPFLMTMMNQSGQQGMNFSDSETDLILQVLRQRMSPEEQGRIDMIRQMSRMMAAQSGPQNQQKPQK